MAYIALEQGPNLQQYILCLSQKTSIYRQISQTPYCIVPGVVLLR